MMKKIVMLTFLFLNYVWAEKLVYVNTHSPHGLLTIEPRCQAVFTQKELINTHFSFKNIFSCPDSIDLESRLKNNPEIIKIENKNSLKFFSSEPLFKYQWGLKNDGSSLFENASLIELTEFKGSQGADIGELADGQQDILVAVIDSGIDLKHPDLINKIYRNENECKMKAEYDECLRVEADKNKCHEKYAKMDTDQNGYPLDCHGWNIAAPINARTGVQGHNNPQDIIGHGTHIAGIIAAEFNGQGVVGVTQKAKILPVKVSGSDEEVPDVGVEIFAKGILYAMKTKAQVINLSLGWSLKEDSLVVRETIDQALKQNIIVIAAGGNAGQSVATYPCAYDGVICVGAHTKDGSLASFSNYGTSIDIIAPGHKILSTWPMGLRSKFFTEVKGYEYKSGTSQATPFVTGAVAKLLSHGLSPSEVELKLLKGSKKYQSQKDFTQNGNLHLPTAFKTTGGYLRILKNTLLVNDTGEIKAATIKYKIIGDSIKGELRILNSQNQTIQTQNVANDVGLYEATINLKNENPMEFSNRLKLSFESYDFNQTLYKDLEFFRYLDVTTNGDDIEDIQFMNAKAEQLKDLGCKAIANLEQFFCYKTVKNTVFVSFINAKEATISPLIPLNIKRTIFPFVGLVDIDQDQEQEYLVMSFEQNAEKKWEAQFLFFNLKGMPKKIQFNVDNKFKNDITTISSQLHFKKIDGKINICWISMGTKPDEEVQSSLWRETIKNERTQYLYCLNDKKVQTLKLNGFTPFSFLKDESILAFKGSGLKRELSIFSWPDFKETKLPPSLIPFDFTSSSPVLSANGLDYFNYSTGLNHYFSEFDSANGVWTQLKFKMPMAANLLANDQNLILFNNKYDLGVYNIDLDQYAYRAATYETKRVEHLYLAKAHGLYLPSFRSSNLISETLLPITQSGVTMISAPSRYHILASGQCYEIGPLPDIQGQRDTIFYLCPQNLLGKRVYISR